MMFNPKEHPRVVLLLSGGLDSATLLYHFLCDGVEVYPLYVQFGDNQAAQNELRAVVELLKASGAKDWKDRLRRVTILPFPPVNDNTAQLDYGIAKGYIPGRNTLFCSFAYQYAVQVGADVCIGVTASDAQAFPDCRPYWATEMRRVYAANNRAFLHIGDGPRLLTPFINFDRREIRKMAASLGVPVQHLSLCYTPLEDGSPCGECEGCKKDD